MLGDTSAGDVNNILGIIEFIESECLARVNEIVLPLDEIAVAGAVGPQTTSLLVYEFYFPGG
jgi:hypothetical protein